MTENDEADAAGKPHVSADERRVQLMDAAIAVMAEQGVAAASTRAIAQQAGLAHGVFHYCFRSKIELFAALFERELRQSIDGVMSALLTETALEAAIAAGLGARWQSVRADPGYAQAMSELTLAARRAPELTHLARWEQEAYRDEVATTVQTWSAERGVVWEAPVRDIAALILALSEGITHAWLAERDDSVAEASIALAARSITRLAKETAP